MKQLYYTISSASKGLGHADGFQIRAASLTLTSDQCRAAEKCAGYALPRQTAPSDEAVLHAPVRLALLDTPGAGRLLCHSVYAGHDPLNPARQGNYFSHLLLDLPPDLDVRRAILSWRSSFWKCTDDISGTQLDEVSDFPSGDVMNDHELQRFLQEGGNHKLLRFVMSAQLTIPSEGRIFVGASPKDVALCIYGLSRVLPRALLEKFTFSTYEYNPLMSSARLIGTCWGDEPPERGMDLPSTCYSHPHAGYNSHTDRNREWGFEVPPYVDAALHEIASGRYSELDLFLDQCEKIGVTDASLLDPFYRLERKAGLPSQAEFQPVLKVPRLASRFLSDPGVQGQVVKWIVEEAFASRELPQVLKMLHADPALRDQFMAVAREVGLNAFQQGEIHLAVAAMEQVFIPLAPDRSTVWAKVIQDLQDPSTVPWQARIYLLQRMATEKPPAGAQKLDPFITSWLKVSETEFIQLLGLSLPLAYKLVAWTKLDLEVKTSPKIVSELGRFPEMAISVLERVAESSYGEEGTKKIGRAILEKATRVGDIIDNLVSRPTISTAVFDVCLQVALAKGFDSLALVRRHGRRLAERLDHCSVLERFVRQFLERCPPSSETDTNIHGFIEGLKEVEKRRPEIATILAPLSEVKKFLAHPILEPRLLESLANALKLLSGQQRAQFTTPILAMLIEQLNRSPTLPGREYEASVEVQAKLETVLNSFGPILAESPAELFRRLLEDCQQRADFWRNLELVAAFLAIALGAARDTGLEKELALVLLPDAGELAKQFGKHAGKRQFECLNSHAANWSTPACDLWKFMAEFIQPTGLFGQIRRWFVLSIACLAGVGSELC